MRCLRHGRPHQHHHATPTTLPPPALICPAPIVNVAPPAVTVQVPPAPSAFTVTLAPAPELRALGVTLMIGLGVVALGSALLGLLGRLWASDHYTRAMGKRGH